MYLSSPFIVFEEIKDRRRTCGGEAGSSTGIAAAAGADVIWFAMPITELVTAVGF